MRERRRVRRLEVRLDHQLSQIVVEEEIDGPPAEVLPDTGAPPKGRGRVKRATPPTPKRVWSPKESRFNRRLSAVWADREVIYRPRTRGVKTRSQTSLDSEDSFKSMN